MTNGTRRGWGVSLTPWPLFTPRKDTVVIVQEAGWAPGLVWTGAENLAPTRIRSLDRPVRSSVAIPTELPGLPAAYANSEKFLSQRKTQPTNKTHQAHFTYEFHISLSEGTYTFHISLFPFYLELFSVRLLTSVLSRPLNPRERKCNGKWGSAEGTLNCTPPFRLSHTQLTKWMNRNMQRAWGL